VLMSAIRSSLFICWITLSCCAQRLRSCFDVIKGLFEGPLYYGLPRYLAVFRVSVIIMLKNDNDLLCTGSVCSFVRQCGHFCLAFHECDTLVLFGSCICPYRYFPREPLARFVPALVSWGASSMPTFLSLALCQEHWTIAYCSSKRARWSAPLIGGYWESASVLKFLSCYTSCITNEGLKYLRLAHVGAPVNTREGARACGSVCFRWCTKNCEL